MAGPKGLEPSTSCVTGRRSNQLNYDPISIYKLTFTNSYAKPLLNWGSWLERLRRPLSTSRTSGATTELRPQYPNIYRGTFHVGGKNVNLLILI